MKRTALLSALALAALTAGACLPGQAQTSARAGVQTGIPAGTPTTSTTPMTPMTPQAGAPTPQQAQKAQENRSDAEAYLQRAEAAAANGRSQGPEPTNRDAGSPAADAPAPYGPQLHPRQPPVPDAPPRKAAEPQ
jgi:hypothetical protein